MRFDQHCEQVWGGGDKAGVGALLCIERIANRTLRNDKPTILRINSRIPILCFEPHFRRALAEVFGRHPDIRLIVHEQTLLRGGAATEIANGLKALILETAASKGVEVSCVHTTELKKWAAGSGRADKAAMVEACRRRSGRDPRDDNEADAIAILIWAIETKGGLR